MQTGSKLTSHLLVTKGVMNTIVCAGMRPTMTGMVTPRDDSTRKRVTGGIFLISARISAILNLVAGVIRGACVM